MQINNYFEKIEEKKFNKKRYEFLKFFNKIPFKFDFNDDEKTLNILNYKTLIFKISYTAILEYDITNFIPIINRLYNNANK